MRKADLPIEIYYKVIVNKTVWMNSTKKRTQD